jgi:hypothetical protein
MGAFHYYLLVMLGMIKAPGSGNLGTKFVHRDKSKRNNVAGNGTVSTTGYLS